MKLIILKIFCFLISVECGLIKGIFNSVHEDINQVKEDVHKIINKTDHVIHNNILTNMVDSIIHRKKDDNHNKNNNADPSKDFKDAYTTSKPGYVTDSVDVEKNTKPTKVQAIHTIERYNNSKQEEQVTSESDSHNHTKSSFFTDEVFRQTTEKSDFATSTNISDDYSVSIEQATLIDNDVTLEHILKSALRNDTYMEQIEKEVKEIIGEMNFEDGDKNKTIQKDEEVVPETTNGTHSNPSKSDESKQNLISDQMFFNDNKPGTPRRENTDIKSCADGLVKAANGDCLEQVNIDLKSDNPLASLKGSDVFKAGCPSGTARALDNSCEPKMDIKM